MAFGNTNIGGNSGWGNNYGNNASGHGAAMGTPWGSELHREKSMDSNKKVQDWMERNTSKPKPPTVYNMPARKFEPPKAPIKIESAKLHTRTNPLQSDKRI